MGLGRPARPKRDMSVLGRTASRSARRRTVGVSGASRTKCLEKEPGVERQLAQGVEERRLDAGNRARGGLPHDAPKPMPTRRRGDVHDLAHAGRAEPEEGFRGAIVVARDERHGGDAGEVADQVAERFHVVGLAAMYRDEHGIHRPLSHHADGIGDGVAVYHGEAAAAGGIDAGTLAGKQHGGDGRGKLRDGGGHSNARADRTRRR